MHYPATKTPSAGSSGLTAALFFLGLLVGSGQALQAQQFEGSLTYSIQTDGEAHHLTYYIKNDMARVEMAVDELGGDMVMLINMQDKKIRMVIDPLNAYMEMNMPDTADEQDADNGEIQETNETKTIANVECRKYVFTDDDGSETEIWSPADQDFGRFLFPEMGDDLQASASGLTGMNIFPFLVVNEAEGFRMEVQSVNSASLEDALFVVPTGYRKMEIPGFGQ